MKAVKRATLATHPKPVGAYAVMRHSDNMKRCHFMCLHDSYESASAEAVRLLGGCASLPLQSTYYVVEIAAFFSAGPQGLRSQER